MTSIVDTEMLIQGNTSAIEAEIWYIPEQPHVELYDHAFLEGPYSTRGKTLTTRYSFVRSKLGEQDAWKATILEPVLWSPQMPALYELGGLRGTALAIGLRDIRIKQDSFYWADNRWVARGAVMDLQSELCEKDSSNPQKLLTIVPPLASTALGETDRVGLPLMVDATQVKNEQLSSVITRLSSHVSVTMILLPQDCQENQWKAAHSHVLLGSFHDSASPPPIWAKFVGVSESLLSTGWKAARRLPVVATRECVLQGHSPDGLRAMCDQFQADLDRGADYAGLWLLPKATS